jgi:hypothetical protein
MYQISHNVAGDSVAPSGQMTARHAATEPVLQILLTVMITREFFQQFAARVKCVSGGLAMDLLDGSSVSVGRA